MPERVLKVGVVLPLFSGDPKKVGGAAREAEDLGFDGAFAFDHFFPPGGGSDRPSLEAFTSLAAIAAATTRIEIGTLVTRAILRPSGMLAKLVSSIDLISAGRMILGIGTGDPIDRPEHHAFGFPDLGVGERRAHLEETVTAVGRLFRGEPYPGGVHVGRLAGPLLPPPVRPGGPPIWIGAQSDAVVRLAARVAGGWNGWGNDVESFRRKASLLAEEAAAAGRSADATWAGIVLVGEDRKEVAELLERRRQKGMADSLSWSGTAEEFVKYLYDLGTAGARWAILVPAGPDGRRELIAERVLPALSSG
jgi:alkanesulfonate monooxygenase SsuD/methylene tetrahydromethanopterin reductase-like flavin-dependent oxidoreductase (luciferase family)